MPKVVLATGLEPYEQLRLDPLRPGLFVGRRDSVPSAVEADTMVVVPTEVQAGYVLPERRRYVGAEGSSGPRRS